MTTCRIISSILCITITSCIFPITTVRATTDTQAHPASGIMIDEDGTMVKDGRRRFVYGTFRDPSDDWRRFEGLRQGRFNLTHSYAFENRTIKTDDELEQYINDAREYLERAAANDVGVFLGLPRNLVREAELGQITTIVEALKNMPALWFWYLMDEPSHGAGFEGPIEEYSQVYQRIKELDPHRLVVVVDNQYFHNYPFDQMADMIWADRYPAPWGIKQIKEVLDEANRNFPDMPKAWSVPCGGSGISYQAARQGRDDFVQMNDQTHRPNAMEIRAQAHAAIAGGAQGIVWYWYPQRWHDLRVNTPKIWRAIVDLGTELQMLEPALISQEPIPEVKLKVSPTSRMQRLDNAYYQTPRTEGYPKVSEDYDYRIEPEVLHWKRWHDGALYLGIVNAGYQTQVRVTVTLPFAFSQAIQFPEGYQVMNIEGDQINLQAENIPVTILEINGQRELTLVMNECDTVVWRFNPAE